MYVLLAVLAVCFVTTAACFAQLFDTDNHLNTQAGENYIFTTEGHVIPLSPRWHQRPWVVDNVDYYAEEKGRRKKAAAAAVTSQLNDRKQGSAAAAAAAAGGATAVVTESQQLQLNNTHAVSPAGVTGGAGGAHLFLGCSTSR